MYKITWFNMASVWCVSYVSKMSSLLAILIYVLVLINTRSFALSDPLQVCPSMDYPALLSEPNIACEGLLDHFAVAYSNFTDCVIRMSVPTCLCETCWDAFLVMDRTYFAIKQYDSQNTFHSSTPVGERCTEVLLHSDKLASISRLYDSAVSIWTDATCNCCVSSTANGPVLNSKTVQFYKYLKNLTKCFAESEVIYQNLEPAEANLSHTVEYGAVRNSNMTNISKMDVCYRCKKDYQTFISFARHHFDVEGSECPTCADIVHHLNKTRLLWSDRFLCDRFKPNYYIVVGLGVLAGSIPLLFYCGNCAHGTFIERRQIRHARRREVERERDRDKEKEKEKEFINHRSAVGYGSTGTHYRDPLIN